MVVFPITGGSSAIKMGEKMLTKNWFKSKTLWFNVLTIGLACFAVVTDTLPVDPVYIVLVNGIGNVLLRAVTKSALTRTR